MILIRQVGFFFCYLFVTASCVCVFLVLVNEFPERNKRLPRWFPFSSSGVFVAFNFRPVLLEIHVCCLKIVTHTLYTSRSTLELTSVRNKVLSNIHSRRIDKSMRDNIVANSLNWRGRRDDFFC